MRKGKKIILITMFISIFISIILSFLATEKWSAYSIITKPSISNYRNLYKSVNLIENISGHKIKSLEGINSSNLIFERFIQEYNSSDTKFDFITKNKKLLSQYEGEDNFHKYKEISDSIRLDKVEKRNEFNLSFQAKTADLSYDILDDYIKFVEDKVNKDINENLALIIQSQKDIYKNRILTLNTIANNKIKRDIEKAEISLDIAKKAQQNEPVKDTYNTSSNEFDFIYGERILKSKLDILMSNRDKLKNINSTDLINTKLKLSQLNNISISELNTQPFKFLQKPLKPEQKIFPNKKNFVFFGAFIGFIIGFLIVMVRLTFSEMRN
ncbi:Wzz/FepE/Etk N-terminal domain-containing protein [Photobacterium leiognathi]|uniref:Wzz/FepE/Etk N-terminal domain-containing protein n=1 Tax=Photobacterium leiognathi TaxID=553611 RepID=UPI002981E972|nr:Wzz/FepE/Etk N-terminal domain-containing protein [Photobacterium leiognathi]